MGRQLFLLIAIASLLVAGSPQAAEAAAQGCAQVEINAGTCDVSAGIGTGSVDLEGSETSPGSGGSGGSGGGGVAPEETGPGKTPEQADAECDTPDGDTCFALGPEGEVPVTPADPAETVTLADIASFRPVTGVGGMEPDGWVIAGLDANFYASGGTHVVDGTLLGQPASVRFTPVAWTWSYGDGSTVRRTTPGATWQQLGIPEFDPTPTSHVYAAEGTYYVDLVIDYSPEYRFGGQAWARIPGILAVPANRLTITAGSAKTVLVERDCARNPRGPGC